MLYEINNVFSPINFEVTGIVERTLQNCKNLLMCNMGEIPYDRYRGFDAALYDLPLDEIKEKALKEVDRLLLWEPDAEAIRADCTLDKQGKLVITVTINIDIEE